MDDYIQQLFPYLPAGRIRTLSCGHVIPASNLFVSPVSRALDGSEFDFTFNSRDSQGTITKLGESLIRLVATVPDGAVIFFPSYAYLDKVATTWKRGSSSSTSPIWSRLEKIKPIFTEGQSSSVDETLSAYSSTIQSHSNRGALLLSVIGGKLSEGINFSDRLGRCVIVVGLPYPNPHSPEWKAKMEYIESKAVSKAGGACTGYVKGAASREFAENVCMRAVNQAIGRAIRHKGDWASILLLDRRYNQQRIRGKLPGWIQGSLRGAEREKFGDVEGNLKGFLDGKRVR